MTPVDQVKELKDFIDRVNDMSNLNITKGEEQETRSDGSVNVAK